MQLPDILAQHSNPKIVRRTFSMTVEGINYRLTKHGRRRYLERVGQATDAEIVRKCIGNPKAVWKPDRVDGFKLVTYKA